MFEGRVAKEAEWFVQGQLEDWQGGKRVAGKRDWLGGRAERIKGICGRGWGGRTG